MPVLKKPTLDPNDPSNYRPITISSVFAKLSEKLLTPQLVLDHLLCDSQFGFRPGRDTLSACALLNDLLHYYHDQGTAVYICSLDAEKCFDKIWHDGLFFKLWDVLPLQQWTFLRTWYSSSTTQVRWNSVLSAPFHPTRGTKQGSLLSPALFNIFLNDLLLTLQRCPRGLRIGSHCYNSFAYADDVTLMSCLPEDLQCLINICEAYAEQWRFSFGLKKTQCMTVGKSSYSTPPSWTMKGTPIQEQETLTILGVTFSANLSAGPHVEKRIQNCRRGMFSLAQMGSMYPGLCTAAKRHLWLSIGLPTLTYGLEAVGLRNVDERSIDKCQTTMLKTCLGLRKRSHHSDLLDALRIAPVTHSVHCHAVSLLNRMCATPSPARTLMAYFCSLFIVSNVSIPGTLFHSILCLGLSPLNVILSPKPKTPDFRFRAEDGLVECGLLASSFIQ